MIRKLRTERDNQQWMLDLALNMRGRVQNFERDDIEVPSGKRARNYRMLPKTDVQGEVDDVGKALAYAQAHAADWGGDASRFTQSWAGDVLNFSAVAMGSTITGVVQVLEDHARLDLMLRSGAWAKIRAAGVYPVVTAQSIAYRRSLVHGQRYVIESRIVGYTEKHVYIEQRSEEHTSELQSH